MSREYRIYTAAKMGGLSYEEYSSHRFEATRKLNEIAEEIGVKVLVVNPSEFYNFESVKHKSEREVMNFDLWQVKKSDAVLLNLNGVNTSIGTSIEVYEAWKNDVPVIAYGDISNVHPWVLNCIHRHEETMDLALGYIRDFILI